MATADERNDRLLNNIIVYGFALAFGAVAASSQALRPTSAGFAIEFSWWTLVALLGGTTGMVPLFWVIVNTEQKNLRRASLFLVTLLGLGAFFYPLRVVPREKFAPVFVGLAVAVLALSFLAGLLLLLHRFFEKEERKGGGR
jgi:hypothetical protein